MRNIYFTVGPSQLYPTVPKHINRVLKNDIYSTYHRGKKFAEIYLSTTANLRQLLDIPNSHHIFFTSSALEAMERVVQNTIYKRSYHFVNGSFSKAFWQTAVAYKKNAGKFEVPLGQGFNFSSIKVPKLTEVITLAQNETSSGVSIPMEMIYKLKKNNPKVLIALDIVSSVPYVNVDFTKIDMVLFSVQKGFGLPSGLGVLIVNEKAIEKAKFLKNKNISTGGYHSFANFIDFEKKSQTPETPNIANIYLLGRVAEDMLKIGIKKIRKDTEEKAKLIYDFFDSHSKYKSHVETPFRSKTIIVIDVMGKSKKIVNKFKKKGIVIAKGYGENKDNHIRIGNFPAHSISQLKKLVNSKIFLLSKNKQTL